MNNDKISVVVPCHNEEESINIYLLSMEEVRLRMNIDFEYIFVNDGSKDKTLSIMRELSKQNPESVRYISLSRNFGKESALYAGLESATGNYITVMDVDLQDPPELLEEMYKLIQTTDYDCIGTRRISREGEPAIRSLFAKQFYKIINKISETEIVGGARDFRLMTRQMVDAILKVTEYNRFSKGIFSWVGFDTYYLEYNNIERETGKTSWSFWSLLSYSIEGIVSFSEVPLLIASFIGLLAFLGSILFGIIIAIRTLVFDNPTAGWTSLVVLITGLGGLQLLCLGILGKYMGKTFLETKNRPIYLVKETESDLKNKID